MLKISAVDKDEQLQKIKKIRPSGLLGNKLGGTYLRPRLCGFEDLPRPLHIEDTCDRCLKFHFNAASSKASFCPNTPVVSALPDSQGSRIRNVNGPAAVGAPLPLGRFGGSVFDLTVSPGS